MDNTVVTINPANEQVISEYENMTNEQVTNIVSKSRSAFSEWRRDVRKDLSYCFIGRTVRKDKERLANCISRDGKQ